MIILREKNYSFISDIKHSGIKRSLKKAIGNARSKLADRLSKKYIDEPVKNSIEKIKNSVLEDNLVNNPQIERKLLREANSRGARVLSGLDSAGGSSYNLKYKDIRDHLSKVGEEAEELGSIFDGDKSGKRLNNKIKNILKSKKTKHVISYSPGDNVSTLAHEIGHVDNAERGGVVKKLINNISGDPNLREEISSSLQDKSSAGVISSSKRFLKSRAIIREEKNASKKGLSLLKKSGASREELSKAKKDLDSALESYKATGNAYYRNPLINRIQIPSRRKSTIERIGGNY